MVVPMQSLLCLMVALSLSTAATDCRYIVLDGKSMYICDDAAGAPSPTPRPTKKQPARELDAMLARLGARP
jgi:hypothetical protein